MFLACGTLVTTCLRAAERLRERARPARRRGQRPVRQAAGQGHGVQGDRGVRLRPDGRGRLPAWAVSARPCWRPPTTPALSTAHVRRLGLPDRFVLHAERDEQLAEVGLDVEGITRSALELAQTWGWWLRPGGEWGGCGAVGSR